VVKLSARHLAFANQLWSRKGDANPVSSLKTVLGEYGSVL
jgi:hypothetical protein